MNTALNPSSVPGPLAAYSQTIKVPRDAEWLLIAGQVGVDMQGKVPDTVRKQTDQTFKNLLGCLKENGMSKKDLVKLTVYLTDSRFVADYRASRKRFLGDAVLPTSTLVIVQGLAAPELLVEIEGWAAKTGGRHTRR